MATFTKFYSLNEALAEKVHNLGSDQLKVALTNSAPVATNTKLSDLTEISYTYCSSRNITTVSSSQTTGNYALVNSDLTLTASGGAIGPFRYIVIFNDTATNKELLAWGDYGSSITVNDGETFTLDFGATTFTISY